MKFNQRNYQNITQLLQYTDVTLWALWVSLSKLSDMNLF